MLKSPLIEDPHKFLRTKQEPYSHLLDPLPPSGKPKGKGICSYCKVKIMSLIMPSTLEKLKWHIAFGSSVHVSVRPLQNLSRYSFEISYMDSSSKNNLHIFFKSGLSPFVELCPF